MTRKERAQVLRRLNVAPEPRIGPVTFLTWGVVVPVVTVGSWAGAVTFLQWLVMR